MSELDQSQSELGKLHLNENGDLQNENEDQEDIVDPWNVVSKSAAGIDYDKLIGYLSFTN